MKDAFRRAVARLLLRGELQNRPAWVHELARTLTQTVAKEP